MAFVPAQFGEYDPHAGMGGFSFKKLFKVTKKSFQPKTILKVAASVVHAAIRPVEVVARATTAVALQSVGLKTLAKEVGGNTISKGVLKTSGTIVDVAAVVVAGVVAAPFVAAGAAAVAGGVASAATAVAGAVGSVAGGTGTLVAGLAKKAYGLLAGGGKAPAHSELSAEEQAAISPTDYAALIEQQAALVASGAVNQTISGVLTPAVTPAAPVIPMAATPAQQVAQMQPMTTPVVGQSSFSTPSTVTEPDIPAQTDAAQVPAQASILGGNMGTVLSIAAPLILIGFLFSTKSPKQVSQ